MSAQPQPTGLETLDFDNRFTLELPGDPEIANFRRQVPGACYSRVMPTPVAKPELVACSPEVAALLDLDDATCRSREFLDVFAGNRVLDAMQPYAACYGGHQFGNWAGQLGDGRAINLGEIVNRRGQRWALQLKGAGPTPYSRNADGLAVLRSSLREFLCSEAMHHLGVPTTRALSLALTGESVVRDMFYDGNAQAEPGAVVCRVAPSFTRFGSFEICAARGEHDLLRQLLDYTLRTDFPELEFDARAAPADRVPFYLAWFEEVCRRTAEMIVHWMRVGFVHGVMNTDNMSVLGLTIDYGPYGWLENYDPDWTPNTTDAQGRRYRYGQQPPIALWNLVQLANAIHPLVDAVEPLEKALNVFGDTYEASWRVMMARKLGLRAFEGDADGALVSELLEVLAAAETDMTIFYRRLASLDDGTDDALLTHFDDAFYVREQITGAHSQRLAAWLRRYLARVNADGRDPGERRASMNAVNPKYVLRNYLAQLAIDEATNGNYALTNELLDTLRRPYDEQPERAVHAGKRPEWARHRAGCSMLSCSS